MTWMNEGHLPSHQGRVITLRCASEILCSRTPAKIAAAKAPKPWLSPTSPVRSPLASEATGERARDPGAETSPQGPGANGISFTVHPFPHDRRIRFERVRWAIPKKTRTGIIRARCTGRAIGVEPLNPDGVHIGNEDYLPRRPRRSTPSRSGKHSLRCLLSSLTPSTWMSRAALS